LPLGYVFARFALVSSGQTSQLLDKTINQRGKNKMLALRNLLRGAALVTALVMPTASLAETKTPVKGKIFNNLMDGGMTQGVVALNMGDEKLKCAMIGVPIPPDASFSMKFIHTVVCEDHSEVSFLTKGNPTGVLQVCSPQFTAFSFLEVSTPDLTRPTKGLFEGIKGGSLTITGTVNCELEIDMTFAGYAIFN
jgi:hypothetical protein